MRRHTWASRLGTVVAGSALAMFVALPAFAEPPSHGFHHHPQPGPGPSNQHKPHAPHPTLNPPPGGHKPHAPHQTLNPPPSGHKPHAGHPTLNPPPSGHVPHVAHKPHPELNPFAPPKP